MAVWKSLQILDLEVTLEAEETIKLPFFQNNALRVGLGTSLHQTVCINKQAPCSGCSLETLCAYHRIFAAPSYPYWCFFAADTPANLQPGALFKLHLRLFGPAVAYYPYFYFALENLAKQGVGLRNEQGRRGCFNLKAIAVIIPDGQRKTIFARENDSKLQEATAATLEAYLEPPKASSNLIRIEALSPIRIKYLNHFASDLEFHVLLRGALRRLSSLYQFATGQDLPLDYQGLIAKAMSVQQVENHLSWFDYTRYSTTQLQEMKLGGVVGNVSYQGKLAELYPFIKAAEILGVGKGMSFGFGRFKASIEEGKED